MFFNEILFLVTGLLTLLIRVQARECSDRDYSASTWNFVECVENNFNSLTSDDYDQRKRTFISDVIINYSFSVSPNVFDSWTINARIFPANHENI